MRAWIRADPNEPQTKWKGAAKKAGYLDKQDQARSPYAASSKTQDAHNAQHPALTAAICAAEHGPAGPDPAQGAIGGMSVFFRPVTLPPRQECAPPLTPCGGNR
jgi:hypothetical protein